VVAPLGTIVNESPEQIAPEFTVIIGNGNAINVHIAVFEPTQPKALVPVML
jgi:hypothetical protein